jgi:hypothetical protein
MLTVWLQRSAEYRYGKSLTDHKNCAAKCPKTQKKLCKNWFQKISNISGRFSKRCVRFYLFERFLMVLNLQLIWKYQLSGMLNFYFNKNYNFISHFIICCHFCFLDFIVLFCFINHFQQSNFNHIKVKQIAISFWWYSSGHLHFEPPFTSKLCRHCDIEIGQRYHFEIDDCLKE